MQLRRGAGAGQGSGGIQAKSRGLEHRRNQSLHVPASGDLPLPPLPLLPPGDVNFFLNDYDEPHTAEIEIMVAEPRRCGCSCGGAWQLHDGTGREGAAL